MRGSRELESLQRILQYPDIGPHILSDLAVAESLATSDSETLSRPAMISFGQTARPALRPFGNSRPSAAVLPCP